MHAALGRRRPPRALLHAHVQVVEVSPAPTPWACLFRATAMSRREALAPGSVRALARGDPGSCGNEVSGAPAFRKP
eukprot:CAMPEP_0170406984 /NCGR_PEP_ID=MMETSP0117_2-20130122/28009_1 /TAXON_ID=400756 /ORGANISM="Durinskia baltica, Strain CSIRO CS-38" /LENGTH=75 /DNA_ID=CAMNT_0010664209 /DNA_START=90 /DNA_END=314 /DNA_ORIENTATION=+